MPDLPPIVQPFRADTTQYEQACRVIAKHLTTLADELAALPVTSGNDEHCCVCGSPEVGYHNYLDLPFCWPCADGDRPAWLTDVTIEWSTVPLAEPRVRVGHAPSGLACEGHGENAYSDALNDLAQALVGRGDITINDARAAMNLPPWEVSLPPGPFAPIMPVPVDDPGTPRPEPRRFRYHIGGLCPTPAGDGTCGCSPGTPDSDVK